jgi:hypothetical protein
MTKLKLEFGVRGCVRASGSMRHVATFHEIAIGSANNIRSSRFPYNFTGLLAIGFSN